MTGLDGYFANDETPTLLARIDAQAALIANRVADMAAELIDDRLAAGGCLSGDDFDILLYREAKAELHRRATTRTQTTK
ncbi:hypothetical protein NQ036_06935 [Brevibacterium sp. 91QC2O2]|uniref:hypothetical protein n=1 Tax=Brevibacterium sp. 91QC2O2 TaxID=2968458 RepID=UPI00211C96D6|nr:hypothetical protein [Brevibacterium sp. 91QC2O2]MCQ9367979.1 hypothetical protein [Brevibacterium sp. 91QC2O2]